MNFAGEHEPERKIGYGVIGPEERAQMRQLAKSALSLGWALSLLGAKQACGVVAGGKSSQEDLLGPVTQAAVGQLDESMKRIHHSAENVQSRIVEMAFSLMDPARWLNPRSWRAWSSAANYGAGANAATGSAAEAEPEPCCHSDSSDHSSSAASTFDDSASSGWGPMPGDQSMPGR